MSWTPGDVSATSVRIGLRRLVVNCSPMRGNSLLVDVRVCDADRVLAGIETFAEGEQVTDLAPLDVDDAHVFALPHPHGQPRARPGTTAWVGLFLSSTTPIQPAVTTARCRPTAAMSAPLS